MLGSQLANMGLQDCLLLHGHHLVAQGNILDLPNDAGYLVLGPGRLLGVVAALHLAQFTLNLLNLLVQLLVKLRRGTALASSIEGLVPSGHWVVGLAGGQGLDQGFVVQLNEDLFEVLLDILCLGIFGRVVREQFECVRPHFSDV